MAKLVSAKCPICGAPVDVAHGVLEVSCPYCHHTSAVERGTATREAKQGPVIYVAPQRSSALTLFVIAGSLLLVGGTVASVVSKVSGALGAAGTAGRDLIFSDPPLLFDVNADGVIDVIGKTEIAGGATWIAAYDGRDGKELWRTSNLSEDASRGVRGLAGDTVLSVDTLGKVQAYRANNGQPAWASLLGEEARAMCQGDGFVRIRTSDDKDHDLSLVTGQKLSDKSNSPCRTAPGTQMDSGIGYRLVGWGKFRDLGLPHLSDIPGMSAHRALVPDEGKRAFMLGTKTPGSQVAMVAAVEGKKLLWSTLVPGIDPMTTDVNVTTQIVAISGERLVVPYRLKASVGVRMAAFDTKTGNRLWDVPVHNHSNTMSGIAMTDKDVYFASWTALYVMRADTGEIRFRVGKEI